MTGCTFEGGNHSWAFLAQVELQVIPSFLQCAVTIYVATKVSIKVMEQFPPALPSLPFISSKKVN